jgi:hypothetical protein
MRYFKIDYDLWAAPASPIGEDDDPLGLGLSPPLLALLLLLLLAQSHPLATTLPGPADRSKR